MAQFLRPDSTITQTAFTGGFAEIDETTASDADFAYGDNNTAAVLEVGLSDPSGTPQSGTCTARYRIARTNVGTVDGGGNAVTVTGAIFQGTTQIAADSARTTSGTWTEYTFTFNTSAVTNWNDLRFRFTTSASGGAPAARRGGAVSWAEVEIPDPLPPDVTASGSVGTVTTTAAEAKTTLPYIDATVVKRNFTADGFQNSFSYTTGPNTTLMLVLVAYDGTAYAGSNVSELPHLTSIKFNDKDLTFGTYVWRDDAGSSYDVRGEIYHLVDSATAQFPTGTANIVYTPRANSGRSGRMVVVTFTSDTGFAYRTNASFNSSNSTIGFSVSPLTEATIPNLAGFIGVTQTNRPASDLTYAVNSIVLDTFESQEQPGDGTTSYVALARYPGSNSKYGHDSVSGTTHTYAYVGVHVATNSVRSRTASGDLSVVSSSPPEGSVELGQVDNVSVSAGIATVTVSAINGKAPWDEYLAPDGIIEQANISGAIWDIQDDPYNPDALWHEY